MLQKVTHLDSVPTTEETVLTTGDLRLSGSIIQKSIFFYEKAEKHKSKERMIFKKALFQGNDQGGNDPIPPPRPHRYSGGQPSIT